MKALMGLICGTLFGIGLTVSQMTDPNKVLGFLDIFGDWDPTLAFVMGGALLVTWLGYQWVFKSPKPLLAEKYNLPTSKIIDRPLIIGSVLFGAGWGLSGYCPGPAVANLAINSNEAFYFIGSMLVGFVLAKLLSKKAKHE